MFLTLREYQRKLLEYYVSKLQKRALTWALSLKKDHMKTINPQKHYYKSLDSSIYGTVLNSFSVRNSAFIF